MTLQVALGYIVLVGFPLCALLGLVSGYLILVAPPVPDDPVEHVQTLSVSPRGAMLLPEYGGKPIPAGSVIPCPEYWIISQLFWGSAWVTGAAIAGLLFLHAQSDP